MNAIIQSITAYEKKPHSLESLLEITRSIETFIDSLNEIDPMWIETFRTEWWELEFTSALMIENEQEYLSDEDEKAVSQALLNMKMMIEQLVDKTKRSDQ